MALGTTLARTVNRMLRRGARVCHQTRVVPDLPATTAYALRMSDVPPPPPPSYGQQPPPPGYTAYRGGPATAAHPQGTLILVLGIVSFFCFGIITGTIAVVLGTKALKEMDADPSTVYTNRGQINAGRICGIIGAVLSIAGIIYVAVR